MTSGWAQDFAPNSNLLALPFLTDKEFALVGQMVACTLSGVKSYQQPSRTNRGAIVVRVADPFATVADLGPHQNARHRSYLNR